MITKGIITQVIEQNKKYPNLNGGSDYPYYTYRVNMPLFSNSATEDLTQIDAITCLPPHMQNTRYSVGDVVYVGIEDLDVTSPEKLVILGMVQGVTNANVTTTRGGFQTNSNLALENIDTLVTQPQGSVILPYDIKIRANNTPKSYDKKEKEGNISNSKDTPYVTGSEISHLKGQEENISKSFVKVNNAIANSFIQTSSGDVTFNLKASNTQIDTPFSTAECSWEKFILKYPAVNYNYTFQWNSTSSKYYNEQMDVYYDEAGFKEIGIVLSVWRNVGTITANVTTGPIGIEHGGTGGKTAEEARANLGLSKTEIVSEDTWETLQSSNELQPNTVYYIY